MADVPATAEDAMVAAVEGDEMLPVCEKCKTPMELSDMAAKKTVHSRQAFCKSCHSLTNLLVKHVDTKELFSSMTPSEITEFYQERLGIQEPHAVFGTVYRVDLQPTQLVCIMVKSEMWRSL